MMQITELKDGGDGIFRVFIFFGVFFFQIFVGDEIEIRERKRSPRGRTGRNNKKESRLLPV